MQSRDVRAWWVDRPGPVDGGPLVCGERAAPEPGPTEVKVRVSVCGVCRTDLHLAEGDLAPHAPHVVPGHEVVGVVDEVGSSVDRFRTGQRVGIAWLRGTCGRCRFCRRGAENLCLAPQFTGWDADGGFADLAVADEAFVHELPDGIDDLHAAPLLCAGIVGYRALRRSELPDGGRLGIYGFGASAHIVAQVAIAQGAEVHVFTRSDGSKELALELGAASVGGVDDEAPVPLDSAILFAPAGDLVPIAMRALDRGGTLSIAGIHLSDVPTLTYRTDLFEEKQIRSVTANTRRDGEQFLRLAERMDLRPTVVERAFEDVASSLTDLAHARITGAAVVRVDGS